MEKQKISAFEFVFMERYNPEKAKTYLPETEEERNERRADDLREQVSKIKNIEKTKTSI